MTLGRFGAFGPCPNVRERTTHQYNDPSTYGHGMTRQQRLSASHHPPGRSPASWCLPFCLLLLAVGCEVIQAPTVAFSPGELDWGSGEVWFTASGLLDGDSLQVHYHIPETGNPAEFPVLIALHGTGRDARAMRDAWRGEADAGEFMVFAPAFSSEMFPDGEYALGRVLDDDGGLRPERQWSYQVVEDLFHEILRWLDSSVSEYTLYGHSAGAQFAHRFHTLVQDHRAARVLAANAGWYLFPEAQAYPYGLGLADLPSGSLLSPVRLEQVLRGRLIVLLGEENVDPEDPLLNRSEGAMAQGSHRLERGNNYMLTGSRRAFELDVSFGWSVVTVPGVGHSNQGMVPTAAQAVFR